MALPLVVLPGLAELSAGSMEGRLRSEVLPPGEMLRTGPHDRPGGGESYADSVSRIAAAWKTIVEQDANESSLVVAHSVVNRILLSLFTHQPIEEFIRFTQPHGVILRLQAGGAVFCRDVGKWKADSEEGMRNP
jgi:broad specificity phosphatase PhoE